MRIRSGTRPLTPKSVEGASGVGRRVPRLLLALGVGGALLLGPAGPAAADLGDGVTWTATVNGQNVERLNGRESVRLDPAEQVEVVVRIENHGTKAVIVPFVRLEGGVLGLTFYAYATQVDLEAPVGGTVQREFPVRLLGLGTQASGLLPSQVALVDTNDRTIDAKPIRADVRGNVNSVYAVFGMAVGAMALLLLAGVLWRLATGRLSPNRWRRGLALAAPGLGLGFLLTFTLSAFRVATPDVELWASLLLGGVVIGFVAGYLSPTPGDHEGEEPDDGLDDDLLEQGVDEAPADHEPNVLAPLGRPDRAEEPTRSDRWRS